ncbi:hypothetical protein BDW74DRAFT_151975, partial [Aspergillus multicolor]|uniref:uncharacterized protein n=1 Tax=Aspergillus multicolor TaxID=41759 RepID=UPI003CCD1BA6
MDDLSEYELSGSIYVDAICWVLQLVTFHVTLRVVFRPLRWRSSGGGLSRGLKASL